MSAAHGPRPELAMLVPATLAVFLVTTLLAGGADLVAALAADPLSRQPRPVER